MISNIRISTYVFLLMYYYELFWSQFFFNVRLQQLVSLHTYWGMSSGIFNC